MKILVVSAAFYPENSPRSFRTTELVKEFCRQGHQVTVIAPYHPQQDPMIKEYGFVLKDMGFLSLPEITWNGGNRVLSLVSRGFRRLLLIWFEYPAIQWMFKVKKALKDESGYDMLISIAVPHMVHWGVAWARKDNHPIATTWIADCGDPYVGVSYAKFPKPFYFKNREKAFCRKTDFITVPVENARTAYYPEFRNKIRVIPQGFKFEEARKFFKTYKPNMIPTFCYAGNFIPGRRDIRPVLDYLLKTNKDFRFHIYTKQKTLITPYIEKAKEEIIVHDFIPRNELLSVLSKMDFLVNLENGVSEQVPSKLIDYCLAGRPTLSLDSNNMNTIAIDEFLNRDYTQQFSYPDIEIYNIENICRQFLELVQQPHENLEFSKTK